MLTIIREHIAEMELLIRMPPKFVALVTGGAVDDASFRALRAELGVALHAPEDSHPGSKLLKDVNAATGDERRRGARRTEVYER